MKITPTSLTINQLFGAPNEQYIIPTYQRRYSWSERQIWELIEDVGLIEEGDTHCSAASFAWLVITKLG
jgi:uncharacterized protein with ParB-like and HNH nuclease domain